MNNILITIRKEIRSIFRDKKTFFTLLIFPFVIPVFIFLEGYISSSYNEDTYAIGINYEINDIESTLLDEVSLVAYNYDEISEMEKAYSKGEIVGYIDYNEDKKIYTVYTNRVSSDGMYASGAIEAYLKGYKDYLKELYLVGEDVDLDFINNVFLVESVDLDGENYMLELLFVMSFTYVIMAILASSTNMAISATAVEKENGTLETLLTFPVKIRDLVIGKYIAAAVIGFISSLVGLVVTISSLFIATEVFDSFKDINFSIDAISVVLAVVVIMLASLFIAGISILVTSGAKSFKEAQSIASILNLVALVPLFVSLCDIDVLWGYYLIPIFNYTQMLMDLFSGELVLFNILLVVGSSFVYTFGVIYMVIKWYRVEKILF